MRRIRRGVTLIEVLVALILLEIGMLALAATTAVAARDLALAHRTSRAHRLAGNQLEVLKAAACTAAPGIASITGGYELRWSIETTGSRRTISVSVDFPLHGQRLERLALQSAALCLP